jgi:hypothetical protein
MSVGPEMFLDDTVSDTGDVRGANSSSHLVTAGDATDTVTGASGFGMSDDAVFDTGGVISTDFSSLSVLFAAVGFTVAAAAGAVANATMGHLSTTSPYLLLFQENQ